MTYVKAVICLRCEKIDNAAPDVHSEPMQPRGPCDCGSNKYMIGAVPKQGENDGS